jgi:Asp-tRNA(Asn)/Glu-tRNA(Gln) amidotransferase A subunit family amidase
MAQVMSGLHEEDPFSLPDDGMDLLAALEGDSTKLRLAYSRDLGVFGVEPAVSAVVDKCVAELRESGLRIDEIAVRLPLDQDELSALWLREVGVLYLEMFDSMARSGLDLLADFRDDIPAPVHEMVAAARGASALQLRSDELHRSAVWRAMQEIFMDYHGLLTPTVAALPVSNAANGATLGPASINGRAVERLIGWCLTHPFNFTGHPAASVPAGLTGSNLPVGLQIVGRRLRDEDVISIARRVEEVRPWLGDLSAAVARIAEAKLVETD